MNRDDLCGTHVAQGTRPTRLVIVSGSFPNIFCGVSRHVDIIARRTAHRDNYDVHVLTSTDPAVDPTITQGYHVHGRVGKWGILQAHHICREILRLRPDVVHIQNPTIKYRGWHSGTMSAVVPLLKRMAPQVRVVVMQHDIAVGEPVLRWRYYPLFHAADAIVVSNRRDYQAVLAVGISRSKLYLAPVSSHLTPTANSASTRASGRDKFGIDMNARCVAYFGFIDPARNIDVLVRAIKLLHHKDMHIQGLIMGKAHAGQESYYRKCQQLAEKLRIAKYIIWTGYADHEQIANGLAAADVFVSLMQRGADLRNTSIITAILAHLPIVTTQNPRYYTDTDLARFGCIFVKPTDPAVVADAIAKVLDNPPAEEFLVRRAAALQPDAVWDKHVAVNISAYRGETPSVQATASGASIASEN